ncbi:hypothetical protein FIBSPDRAFT_698382, partial [Athelia psychrophila]
AGQTYGDGQTFMDLFNTDCYTGQRANNVYYPFCTKGDWEMGSWLLQSGLSMCAINDFLKLEKVQTKELGLSFRSAEELRNRAEMLPQGPQWKCKPWKLTHPTKPPVKLFYRDRIECLCALFGNPLFSDAMHYTPFREFQTAAKLVCVYEEWMSANRSWHIQSKIPVGATLLGTILSSDKTNIS